MSTKRRFAGLAFGVFACLLSASGQTIPSQRIIDEALKPSPLERNLRVLTDQIGGRIPGTPAADKAVQWGMDAFKAAGADAVRTEDFTIPSGWTAGPVTLAIVARGTSPNGAAIFYPRAVSISWSPSYNGQNEIVDVGMGKPEQIAKAGDLTGKIVLVHSELLRTWEDLFNEYLNAPGVVAAAVKAHAAAIAWTSTREHDLLYRHINTMAGKPDRIPQVLLAREDSERIARLLADGQKLEMNVRLQNNFTGTIHAKNVIAEIRGSEKPDEWVLIGAHLDSWELGTGALDNGCNAALVIDALRALKASGEKPRRSIRFALFGGEEQGMIGSWAYTKQHESELENAVGVLIFDEGSGPATGFSVGGRKDLHAMLQPMLAPFEKWGVKELTDDAPVGTDNFDFLLEGVPNLIANQQEANYLINYHAMSDTYDKVDFPQLKKHVAIAASLAAALADSPRRIGARQSRAEIEQMMKETQLDEQMKLFGIWDGWANGTRGRKN